MPSLALDLTSQRSAFFVMAAWPIVPSLVAFVLGVAVGWLSAKGKQRLAFAAVVLGAIAFFVVLGLVVSVVYGVVFGLEQHLATPRAAR